MRVPRNIGVTVGALLVAALPACTGRAPEAGAEDELGAPVAASASVDGAAPAPARPAVVTTERPLPLPSFQYPPSEAALKDGFDTAEELAWVAVQAIDRGDKELMQKLLIDEKTYLERLWPAFEGEKEKNTIPGQFHWDHLEMKSLGGILDLTNSHAFQGLRFRMVTHESIADYVDFKLYRRTLVIVDDPATGTSKQLRLFGDIVEIDGKHKLLSYPS